MQWLSEAENSGNRVHKERDTERDDEIKLFEAELKAARQTFNTYLGEIFTVMLNRGYPLEIYPGAITTVWSEPFSNLYFSHGRMTYPTHEIGFGYAGFGTTNYYHAFTIHLPNVTPLTVLPTRDGKVWISTGVERIKLDQPDSENAQLIAILQKMVESFFSAGGKLKVT